jgi:tetratricopeptide (TPR) repeat protein
MAKRSRKPNRVAEPMRAAAVASKSVAWGRDWPWAVLLCVGVIIAYSPVWTTNAADICPLTLTTLWLGHAIWGLAPLPYHLLNVALHAGGAVVLWLVLRALRVPGAWLGAALWALHPVNVESVAWIAEIKNAQSGLFFLLSIFFFVKSLRAGEGTQKSSWNRFDTAFLLFAFLAMASKSSTVILPLVLLLCAWWVESRIAWRVLVKVSPVFVMSVASGVLALWTQQWTGAADLPYTRGWLERILTAADAAWFYLGKLLWPHPLIPVYPLWKVDPSQALSYLPLVALVVVAAVLWVKRASWSRSVLFAFAYFVIALLPVLGLVTNAYARYSFVADHFQYLASMGPLALAAAWLVTAINRFSSAKKVAQVSLAAVLLLTVGCLTWSQAWDYQSQEQMWIETLKDNPDSWEALTNLGNIHVDRNDIEGAIPMFRRALEINNRSPVVQYNLALALDREGNHDEAKAGYERALKIYPDYAVAHNALGGILLDEGQLDAAENHLRQAAAENPNFAAARYNLARVYLQRHQLEQAVAELRQAVAILPGYAAAQYTLGQLLLQTGQAGEAMDHLLVAAQADPNDDHTQCALGLAMVQQERLNDAVPYFLRARQLNPRGEVAIYNLSRVMLQLGRVEEGVAYAREAIALNPTDAQAHNSLGVGFAQQGHPEAAIPEFKEALRLAPNFDDAQKNLAEAEAQAAKKTTH